MTPFLQRDGVTIYNGDSRAVLAELPAQSVNCCVTSPPYWGLRDYGLPPSVWGGDAACVHEWRHDRYYVVGGGGAGGSAEAFSEPGEANAERIKKARWREDDTCDRCGAWRGCLGLEPTPQLFVSHLVSVFSAVRGALRDDGTLWLNLGDTYNAFNAGAGPGGWAGQERRDGARPKLESGYGLRDKGLKEKDLIGIPWRVALALQADGWYLRSDIIWAKPNPMPESVKDRPTKSHEYIFLLAKSDRYYYDADAIREPATGASGGACFGKVNQDGPGSRRISTEENNRIRGKHSTQHEQSSARRMIENTAEARTNGAGHDSPFGPERNKRSVWTITTKPYSGAHFAVFPPDLIEPCILAGCPAGGVVLDPFFGSGTTGAVCQQHLRQCIGIDLNLEYCKLAAKRFRQRRLLTHST